jgi:hypothetical protein
VAGQSTNERTYGRLARWSTKCSAAGLRCRRHSHRHPGGRRHPRPRLDGTAGGHAGVAQSGSDACVSRRIPNGGCVMSVMRDSTWNLGTGLKPRQVREYRPEPIVVVTSCAVGSRGGARGGLGRVADERTRAHSRRWPAGETLHDREFRRGPHRTGTTSTSRSRTTVPKSPTTVATATLSACAYGRWTASPRVA